jgi:formaldehyde-activating enzyme involved in methanogenesis
MNNLIFNIFQNNILDQYVTLSNKHVEYICYLKDELEQYKNFYNAISTNNVIQNKFDEYEKRIKVLEEDNQQLLNKLNDKTK